MGEVVSVQEAVGKNYGDFWHSTARYRVVKGGRASKKSKTTALYYISQMMAHPESNTLVVRQTYASLKDSCFSELKWAISRLGVERYWDWTTSPLEMTYLPTGQKILFRGLDDPLKLTSITVPIGYLCWVWIEEAFQVKKEEDFDKIDGSIRGALPADLWKQITLTFNPWHDKIWVKRRFFDVSDDPDVFTKTTTYKDNEFLGEDDRRYYAKMEKENPRRFFVEGLGNWGIIDGLVYENWVVEDFNVDIVRRRPGIRAAFGLDFGYTIDPSAFVALFIDQSKKEIYIFDEFYEKKLSNRMIAERIVEKGYHKERIFADSAEPKSIAELSTLGITRIAAARKGPDSIMHGIQFIQDYKIIIHPSCINFADEIAAYTWAEDRFGQKTGKPVDSFNHILDALRYALTDITRPAGVKVGF